jgi:hypothetical protein
MKERDRLLGELKVASEVKDTHRAAVSEATQNIGRAKAALRATREYKALLAAKNTRKTREKQYKDACDSHDQVERELLTGMTGMDLFDAPKKITRTAPAEAVAS